MLHAQGFWREKKKKIKKKEWMVQGTLTKRWCFTCFHYPGDWEVRVRAIQWVTYGVIGVETCPETGRVHLQGYLEGISRKRLTAMKTLWTGAGLPVSHWEAAKASAEVNKSYCSKTRAQDGTPNAIVVEWGTASQQGRRSDLHDCLELMESGASSLEVMRAHVGVHARHHRWVLHTIEALAEERERKRRKESDSVVLRSWQSVLRLRLLGQNSRCIMWVWESVGHVGKTVLGSYLRDQDGAFVVTGGRWSDIAYAYQRQPIVVFDLTRSQKEMVPYQVMECFKNGHLFSPKYESTTMTFAPAKVIVFANYPPVEDELSADRWDIHHINVL